jgi:hypothetical protein
MENDWKEWEQLASEVVAALGSAIDVQRRLDDKVRRKNADERSQLLNWWSECLTETIETMEQIKDHMMQVTAIAESEIRAGNQQRPKIH